jgi:hypothetical protein
MKKLGDAGGQAASAMLPFRRTLRPIRSRENADRSLINVWVERRASSGTVLG